MQVEINFAKHLQFQKVFSIFSEGCRAAWTDVHEHNPIERNADPQKLKWSCGVGVSQVDPFPRNASRSSKTAEMCFCEAPLCFDRQNCGEVRVFCVWMVMPRSSCNKCVSMVWKKNEIDTLFARAKPFSTKCVYIIQRGGEILVWHRFAEFFGVCRRISCKSMSV